MLSTKRHVLTVAAVIATATMAAGVGALSVAGQTSPPPTAPAQAHAAQPPAAFSWADSQEGGD